MAISLHFNKTDNDLTGCSKMWGFPDLPDNLAYPEIECKDDDGEVYFDPMTFICQIRLEDIAALDTKSILPHEGMMYFFAAIDYFLGNYDMDSPGMGQWPENSFKVLYSPTCDNLHTHIIEYEDGTPYGLPTEAITFNTCGEKEDGFKLLGRPFYDETEDQYPGWRSLFQIDCSDDWNLQLFDCGMINFMQKGDNIECYLHSC